jgi:regulator of cell morphogenesis and NO signaling
MSNLDLNTTVGQWVAHQPNTSHVFEALRIDYCCGGNVPLSQACAERQLDPQRVLGELAAASAEAVGEHIEHWNEATLASLCDNIEQTHHAFLKAELPRLHEMIAKVVGVHGASHPEMSEVRQAFAELRSELEPHMFKEEQVLFPAIRRLEESDTKPGFPFGSIANPIRMMEHEHDVAGDALETIRRATRDYQVPTDVCNTYRAMLDGLQRLEQDLHRHIHKENSILFPRAIQLEQTR